MTSGFRNWLVRFKLSSLLRLSCSKLNQTSLVIPEEASSSLFPLISVGPETLTVEIDKTTESVTDLLDFIFWISPRAEDVTMRLSAGNALLYQYK
ncbi:hypothetical protein CTI12_AA367030 [Artemisia annua]|uniref:Uncharacterized protein n=1 Tax=Artemisia annua TaxID=35608 RepID=A0A2U1MLD7_ARTAN|nr:hypothetical protein CTI12_AA367030 [Artemisia annua]